MFNRPVSGEICCDAPPYSIVRACRMVGLQSPEDVRWCRLSHFLDEHHEGPRLFQPRTWRTLLGRREATEAHCSCGHALPRLEEYTFTCVDGRDLRYQLGQCGRCRSIFWD